ncbi:MAG: single-stranded DNA-binding protein [Bacteroidaceae bacterium]|nr:single-stranded DNA-binding protein [Bacteroidaceae bacterium]
MSINKVILLGNVGRDPEVKYLDQNMCVANVALATSERARTLPNGTQVPERTEWHNLVFWRSLAQTVEKYVHKGDKLYVEGTIRTRNYDDQNGVKRYVTEIYVDTMEMLTPRGATSSPSEPKLAVQPQSQPEQGAETADNSDLPF